LTVPPNVQHALDLWDAIEVKSGATDLSKSEEPVPLGIGMDSDSGNSEIEEILPPTKKKTLLPITRCNQVYLWHPPNGGVDLWAPYYSKLPRLLTQSILQHMRMHEPCADFKTTRLRTCMPRLLSWKPKSNDSKQKTSRCSSSNLNSSVNMLFDLRVISDQT